VLWQILVITFVIGFAVDRQLVWASGRRLPPFFSQLAAAAFITLVATGVSALGSHGVGILLGVDPTLIVVGGIILLVAGMTAVGAMQDAIDQFYVTASARFLEVAMMTAGIVLGILAGLQVGVALGHAIAVSTQALTLGPVVAQFVGTTVISAAFALSAYAADNCGVVRPDGCPRVGRLPRNGHFRIRGGYRKRGWCPSCSIRRDPHCAPIPDSWLLP
jgi:Putative threonine/serine exporter